MKRIFLPLLMISLLGNNLSAMMKEEIKTQEQQQNALTIINASGQKITISPEHYEQAIKCSVVTRAMNNTDAGKTVLLPTESELVTQKNMNQLFDLMGNIINLDQIPEQEIITLFQLADYLNAKSILSTLAEKVAEIVQKYPDSDDKRNLLLLAESCWNHHWDEGTCGAFITVNGKNILKKIYDPVNGILTFNRDIIKKGIKSFDGIEKISLASELFDCNAIRIIDMSNQKIINFRINDLITVFPNLKQLHLTNNKIIKITSDQLEGMPRGFKLYLDNNEISAIENGCFTNFSQFNECIISMKNTKLSAAQEQESFANAQIQEKLNPQGWRAQLARLSYWTPAAIGFGIMGIAAIVNFSKEQARADALLAALWMNQITIDQYRKALSFSSSSWSTIIKDYSLLTIGLLESAVGVTYLKDAMPAFFQTRNPYHLFVKANHNDYNFPTVHHL